MLGLPLLAALVLLAGCGGGTPRTSPGAGGEASPTADDLPLDVPESSRSVLLRLARSDAAASRTPLPTWEIPEADVPMGGGPKMRSRAWYVVDEATGKALGARDAGTPHPIASITKLMAAMVWADAGVADDTPIEILREDKEFIQITRSRLRVGGTYRAGDLLHSALLSSDNRATAALMRSTGLDRRWFAWAMERRARALGLDSVRFGDPSGLDPGNVASARDAALLLYAATRHPRLAPVLAAVEHRYSRLDKEGVFITARSSNRLARGGSWSVLASKTGYTDVAGSCLVMRTRLGDGRDVTLALLGAQGVLSRYGDAARLRAWMERLPEGEEARLAAGGDPGEDDGEEGGAGDAL